MNVWHWLIVGLAGLGLIRAICLARLDLWLEHRGWLHYRE